MNSPPDLEDEPHGPMDAGAERSPQPLPEPPVEDWQRGENGEHPNHPHVEELNPRDP